MEIIAAWVGLVAGLIALAAIPTAWIWKLSKWDSKIGMIDALAADMAAVKKLGEENRLETARLQTMIEPYWETICKNLPGILRLHNSPDPLAAALNGDATNEEMVALIERMETEFSEIQLMNPGRALALSIAVAAVKARLNGFCPCPKEIDGQ